VICYTAQGRKKPADLMNEHRGRLVHREYDDVRSGFDVLTYVCMRQVIYPILFIISPLISLHIYYRYNK
jgi:hypothetical protein